MQIIPAFVTQNKCYQIGTPLKPRGIMLHSVGTPQPSAAVFARSFNQYQPLSLIHISEPTRRS